MFEFAPQGVCSRKINFDIVDGKLHFNAVDKVEPGLPYVVKVKEGECGYFLKKECILGL